MKQKLSLSLLPSLLLASGILASTFAATLGTVMVAPLLLALAVVGADVLVQWQNDRSLAPSAAAWFLAGAFLTAGLIVTLRDPAQIKYLIPLEGVAAWVVLLLQPSNRRNACRII